ncbi:MAG: BON domain-containing protein [Gammaproteobacteria bacterium]|nr:BON domain-containing protein [Gammaproteobacteria bacterium]
MLKRGIQLITLASCFVIVSACTPVLSSKPVTDTKGSRSLGTLYNDQLIETTTIDSILRGSPLLESAHISAVSVNGIVLLVGQVPSESTKLLAGAKAREVTNARKVHNELLVSGPSSYVVRTNDTLITTKVKAHMVGEPAFPATRVKVVTENGVVYLMGLVTHAEAEWAVKVSSAASGIQRIVKVFEYID